MATFESAVWVMPRTVGAREPKMLEDEYASLRRIVAELSLGKHLLQEVGRTV